ncbi:hypothetical protein BDV25DRAFT_159700 [Aspergillus avenaceus]|uniref:Uncharacterized protein n=1 Tax=Aspergillus avenaceus TaxID=36643 RepID=A0A5N6TN56_ASPAV|nr:hypothetical protein BDV25DRAFT_159700 [Aspergillus avenaceus]
MTTIPFFFIISESPLTRYSDLPFPVGLLLASIFCLRYIVYLNCASKSWSGLIG